jgi:hypothetical protein
MKASMIAADRTLTNRSGAVGASELNQELPPGRKCGRPRCNITGEQVRALRDQGMSWRPLAAALGVSTATAKRLYDALAREDAVPKPHGRVSKLPISGGQPGGQHATSKRATEPPRAIVLTSVRRELRERPDTLGRVPLENGRAPGRCSDCGSRAWRRRADGYAQCSICYPF